MIRDSHSIRFILLLSILAFTLQPFLSNSAATNSSAPEKLFAFQSIDTMKYSRDLAREKIASDSFDSVIEMQVAAIAKTGATHIAIATPYDAEFLPFLKRWVAAARLHKLNVWFRGNWSGWEGWFGYSKMSRAQHIDKTRRFILEHADLFSDGDVFSACPECENGGLGDPRVTHDTQGYRTFLIDEYAATKKAFHDIQKDVASNYFSMNGDVAKLVMDQATTKALDGVLTIDHYVKTPEELDQDIREFAKLSGGKVILGEWGAPIPDINGDQSENDQSAWIDATLKLLAKNKAVLGLNYWVNVGGTTELWDKAGTPKAAVAVVKDWYAPRVVYGFVRDDLGSAVLHGTVHSTYGDTSTGEQGYYSLPLSVRGDTTVSVSAAGYQSKEFTFGSKDTWVDITLNREKKGFWYRMQQLWNLINPWRPAYAPTVK